LSRPALHAQRNSDFNPDKYIDVHPDVDVYAHVHCDVHTYEYIHFDDDSESDTDQNCYANPNTQPHPDFDSV
jgi:hypothetical protein